MRKDFAGLLVRLRAGDPAAAGQLVARLYPELYCLPQNQVRTERLDYLTTRMRFHRELMLSPGRTAADELALLESEQGSTLRSARSPGTLDAEPVVREFLESLLCGLEAVGPGFRQIVELKVLQGLSVEEAAQQLHIPVRTAYRRWTFARTWLARHLN